jgi:hypothetical protein
MNSQRKLNRKNRALTRLPRSIILQLKRGHATLCFVFFGKIFHAPQ